jgi:PhnB protein
MAEQFVDSATLPGVIPYLTITGGRGAQAVDFYTKAFGAREVMRMPSDDGKLLMHARLVINGAVVMLSDDFPQSPHHMGSKAPIGTIVHLQVEDADKWYSRAVEAGASVSMAIGDQFWGDRYGQLTDPFGHTWSIGATLKK